VQALFLDQAPFVLVAGFSPNPRPGNLGQPRLLASKLRVRVGETKALCPNPFLLLGQPSFFLMDRIPLVLELPLLGQDLVTFVEQALPLYFGLLTLLLESRPLALQPAPFGGQALPFNQVDGGKLQPRILGELDQPRAQRGPAGHVDEPGEFLGIDGRPALHADGLSGDQAAAPRAGHQHLNAGPRRALG